MKKLVSLIVCIALLIGSCAIGEEDVFSFRNGICFGDSLEMVQEKESNKGEIYNHDSGNQSLLFNKMTLSGVEYSVLHYQFRKENQGLVFIELQYRSVSVYKRKIDLHEDDYAVIQQGLEEKYGNPVQYTDLSELTLAKVGAISSYYKNKDYEFLKANQWILDYDDQKIIIEHSLVKHNEMPAATYKHRLTYYLLDPNEEVKDPIHKDL